MAFHAGPHERRFALETLREDFLIASAVTMRADPMIATSIVGFLTEIERGGMFWEESRQFGEPFIPRRNMLPGPLAQRLALTAV
jgi:hypothetical protein